MNDESRQLLEKIIAYWRCQMGRGRQGIRFAVPDPRHEEREEDGLQRRTALRPLAARPQRFRTPGFR